MNNLLFSLDIGTRSVVGTMIEKKGDAYTLIDLLQIEHKERAMIDGQIHDVISVAKVIQEIKTQFEQKYGPLKEVSVAAAGRSLITLEGQASIPLTEQLLIEQESIQHLELAAVQEAHQHLIQEQGKNANYYCVGYSVLKYELDGETIGSLIDQNGQEATAKVIATFLPKVVIESLIHSLQRADLKMSGLTLEPIAAIQVLIPQSMRKLNVALVDIGAGTSDIAITKDNTISAYGMVPSAGDQITETISSHYLLDFQDAEQVKRKLISEEVITFSDILGFEQEIDRDELLQVVDTPILELAKQIANEIYQLNGEQTPQAVMLIGGGSLTPQLGERLSQLLEMPKQRVAIRDQSAIRSVTIPDHFEQTPALVTPIGIAIAAEISPITYVNVTVNGKPIRLFEFTALTLSDAIIAAHLSTEDLFGQIGQGMTLTVNGQFITVPGQYGKPSVFKKNGEIASIKEKIYNQDEIEVIVGQPGLPAQATVGDLMDDTPSLSILWQGKPVVVEPLLKVNGSPASRSTPLKDRDQLDIVPIQTVNDFLLQQKIDAERMVDMYTVIIDGEEHKVKRPLDLLIDGKPQERNQPLIEGMALTFEEKRKPSLIELIDHLQLFYKESIQILFNEQSIQLEKLAYTILIDGQPMQSIDQPIHRQQKIEFLKKQVQPFVYGDVFQQTDFEIPESPFLQYEVLKNGIPAQFTDSIVDGDHLQINFIPK